MGSGKRIAGLLLCLLMCAAVLTACAKNEPEPVEITLIHGWGSTESDHVAMRSIYQDFEKENPDVRLRMLSMPDSDEVVRKAEDMIMMGEIPDVIFFSGVGRETLYQYMVDHDLALDVMPYLEADEAFADSIAPDNLRYWQDEEGRLFSVSDVIEMCGGYWYDRTVFAAAGIDSLPRTWDQFEQACGKIKAWADAQDNGIMPLQVPAEGYLYIVDHMLAGSGGRSADAIRRDELLIDREELAAVIEDLRKIYTFSEETGEKYSYRDATSLFNEGKTAIYINGIWGAPMIAEDKDVAYALFPSGGEDALACESTYLGYVLGNGRDPAKREASVRFLKYMLSPKTQERILLETGQMPANPHIDMQAYAGQMPRFYQAAETVQSAPDRIGAPSILWGTARKGAFEEHILQVLAGQMDSQRFFDELELS